MRKTLCLAGVFLISGCGTQIDLNDPRLQVTSGLRDACEGFSDTDAEIQAGLEITEQDRLRGYSFSQEMTAVIAGCDGWEACEECGGEIVSQIYGR